MRPGACKRAGAGYCNDAHLAVQQTRDGQQPECSGRMDALESHRDKAFCVETIDNAVSMSGGKRQ